MVSTGGTAGGKEIHGRKKVAPIPLRILGRLRNTHEDGRNEECHKGTKTSGQAGEGWLGEKGMKGSRANPGRVSVREDKHGLGMRGRSKTSASCRLGKKGRRDCKDRGEPYSNSDMGPTPQGKKCSIIAKRDQHKKKNEPPLERGKDHPENRVEESSNGSR